MLKFLSVLPACSVAREACGGAHHVARFCQELGHQPRLMSPLYVRPYVKVHKNDDRGAEAIAEAATRPTMSFVTVTAECEELPSFCSVNHGSQIMEEKWNIHLPPATRGS